MLTQFYLTRTFFPDKVFVSKASLWLDIILTRGKLNRIYYFVRDDTHMTSMKIIQLSNFQDPDPPSPATSKILPPC